MKRILVVDDDQDLTYLVKRILETNGFNVQLHLTGLHVLDVVRYYNPHLILLDIRLYGYSGTGICKQIKTKYDTTVILFSGDIKKGEAYKECDADGFIAKPFDVGEFLVRINQYLELASVKV